MKKGTLGIIAAVMTGFFLLAACSTAHSGRETDEDTFIQDNSAVSEDDTLADETDTMLQDEDFSVDDDQHVPDETQDEIPDIIDQDPGSDEDDIISGDEDQVIDECPAIGSSCVDYKTLENCIQTPLGRKKEIVPCGDEMGCLEGKCTGTCSDECTIEVDPGCKLYDVINGGWSEPDGASSLHDRAREYIRYLQRDNLYYGGIVNIYYKDPPAYTQIDRYRDWGDSAMWTGNYLASEALRLLVTGSKDAENHVKESVSTLHLWFNVSGTPGQLSRYAAPSGQHPMIEWNCSDPAYHCNVFYDGKLYDYQGDVSRDQYTGFMLGLTLAYKALEGKDEKMRTIIRDDVVTLVTELMKKRKEKLIVEYNGTKLPAMDIDLRYSIMVPDEMVNDAIIIKIDSKDPAAAEMWGFREFIPHLSNLTKQIPILKLLPDVPRVGSAIMLTAFFRAALSMTENIPGYEAIYTEINNFFLHNNDEWGNVNNWLDLFDTWSYSLKCGDGYYANNITMEPLYILAQLETIPDIRNETLKLLNKMWPTFKDTKNSFFFYIFAANGTSVAANTVTIANSQLAQFPTAPRIDMPVDLRTDPAYLPHEKDCSDQANHSTAVDVGQRVASDFLWQRHPWALYDSGNLSKTYPGTDYLVAYYMARYHNYISDDKPGQCLREKKD